MAFDMNGGGAVSTLTFNPQNIFAFDIVLSAFNGPLLKEI